MRFPWGNAEMVLYSRSCLPDFAQERQKRSEIQNISLPSVSEKTSTYTADIWLEKLDTFVKDGFGKIGVAEMDQAWVFEGCSVTQSRIIITGVQHDLKLKLAPEPEAGAEVMRQYTRAANSAMTVAAWLHNEGWEARPLTGPMASTLTMIPAAIAAGFGELGKHGSIINPEFGSSFRLSAILTDAPLPSQSQNHMVWMIFVLLVAYVKMLVHHLQSYQRKTVEGSRNGMLTLINVCLFSINIRDVAFVLWFAPGPVQVSA